MKQRGRPPTHGMRRTPTYITWAGMIQRVTNPKHTYYSYYGGRGIKISNDWLIFKKFFRDMGNRMLVSSRIIIGWNIKEAFTRPLQKHNHD